MIVWYDIMISPLLGENMQVVTGAVLLSKVCSNEKL